MSLQNGTQDKNGRLKQPTYTDGRTKQAFKDECDINKMLHRAQKAGTMSHLQKYEGTYSDFADFDFMDAQLNLTRGREVFDELPSEIRNEFQQSPAAFFAYVNDPVNQAKPNFGLPALAQPGRQNIDVSGKTPQGVASEPQASVTTTTEAPTASTPKEAPEPQ